MASIWIVLVLWIFVNSLIKVIQASSCATIHTPATLVLAGSPVSVSCSIDDDCPLTKGKNFHVAWKINKHFLPSNLSYQESNRTYGVIIPSLPEPDTFITCAVCEEENCLIVNGVQVKTGYLPSVPKNLSCSLNVTSNERLLCQWDPGQTNLPTNYTLRIFGVASKKVTSKKYFIPSKAHFFLIPRGSYALLSEVEINVTAVNVLGNSTSETLRLIPMETAIFDPPEITRIEEDVPGCLNYSWILAKAQQWLTTAISLEFRLKTVNGQQDKEMVLPFTKKHGSKINVCDLFHGTNYSATVRVTYNSSSKWSKWSKWSDPKTATTVMQAPTGGLETWLKVYNQSAELYWKPLENFRANGWNLFYTVESKKPKKTLCITQESHCFFSLIDEADKIYLRVTNAAGSLGHLEVPVYRNKGLGAVSNFSVHPESDTSVLIMWGGTPASLSVTGYVLEWRSLLEKAALSFTVMDKNISSTVITGLSPYEPYEMSIYPKYDKGIGSPHTLVAYSRQKAPESAPKLKVVFINSFVKLHWDEILLKDRNGIIRGYTVYIWNDMKNIKVIKTEETSIVLKDLQPVTNYEALLTVHTMGGSFNGSVVPLVTGHIGGIEMVLFVIPACIGLSLLVIIVVFAYFGKNERVKMCLWPIIPDPANSSIKRWTTADSMQGMPSFKEDKEPVLVYLSHFSLLDLDEKEPFKSDYVKENQWSHVIDGRNESHSSIQTSDRYDSEHDRDSVPYATVVFGGPYQNHSTCPPTYVRSESTQPLLGAEDPGSPPPYENLPPSGRASSKVQRFTTFPQNSPESEENEELWEEFPMLRSLEIRDTEHI
ncbi:granulocyte colony-stimulating factor receptor [Puntigrus tetrazona]|uniref:granulocyte colony-stimulating factor receptor n=1 Tax=Puntigrus tetrazona TaxID=1606681 RepID=UPI001C894E1F|nr:granulocyte colony-stimulating factor receptor [Puntigrus tetrazona]XP_043116636.1 granulocyte colony-stimulating factor receptor [Puntigrus tetrazona]XP_043116637.1 granulocyte colony-stimulating factor receptor [Puntigrus tetrazona]XP_043116638.1 granulocyte colony-stimulating factor receptor [Puntigrus tetrazona]